jgi:hypothetical protein
MSLMWMMMTWKHWRLMMTNSKSTKIWAITAEYTSGIMGGMSVWEIYRYLLCGEHMKHF